MEMLHSLWILSTEAFIFYPLYVDMCMFHCCMLYVLVMKAGNHMIFSQIAGGCIYLCYRDNCPEIYYSVSLVESNQRPNTGNKANTQRDTAPTSATPVTGAEHYLVELEAKLLRHYAKWICKVSKCDVGMPIQMSWGEFMLSIPTRAFSSLKVLSSSKQLYEKRGDVFFLCFNLS